MTMRIIMHVYEIFSWKRYDISNSKYTHYYYMYDVAKTILSGAEIFAKRRKRSEKWVVDQEQSQTPNTPVTPKTPTEKLVSHAKLSLRSISILILFTFMIQ